MQTATERKPPDKAETQLKQLSSKEARALRATEVGVFFSNPSILECEVKQPVKTKHRNVKAPVRKIHLRKSSKVGTGKAHEQSSYTTFDVQLGGQRLP